MIEMADYTEDENGALHFMGRLTLDRIGDLPQRLKILPSPLKLIDLSAVERMDSVGAWLVHKLAREHDAQIRGGNEAAKHLLSQVAASDQPVAILPEHIPPLVRLLGEVGDATLIILATLVGLVGFLGEIVVGLKDVLLTPARFRWHAVISCLENVGIRALAIIGIMNFLIGIVIAEQGAYQLKQFGADIYTINLVGRLSLRELGILMTAIMVAGRSGSAFAAQLGTMKLTEEIDAMRTIGVSPIQALVLPRVFATVLMMPLLGFYAALMAMVGGGLFCWISLQIPPPTYVEMLQAAVPMTDLYVGLIKAPVFGLIIAMTGCFQGMLVETDAEQVGLKTTAAVVQAIFLVIVLDAFFAVFFTQIGWG